MLLFALAAAAVLPAPQAAGRQSSDASDRKGVRRGLKYKGDLAVLLAAVADAYGVTIGFEADPFQPTSSVGIELRDASLRDIMDAITKADPRYVWREGGNSVDVYPAAGGSPLLDTVIGGLRVKGADRAAAVDALLNLPELSAGMSAARAAAGGEGIPRGGKVSLELAHVTARAALHEITRQSGEHFWFFCQSADGRQSLLVGRTPQRSCVPTAP